MKTRVKTAALTLAALTVLSGTGILVHGIGADPRQDETGVTSPARTVIQAAPSEPLCPEMLARCAPIPPAPVTRMTVDVPEEPMTERAAEYTQAWNEVVR
ncbi:hypothetical protein [Mycobacteroides abscessus]|uniref:hypothetical protein n=1 Tax=Mycobacteroides abscessus TaxID=36809 RepID=UPI002647900E|nr:hypothetical protein [Mycobacteroides abscessus]MDO3357794.1 hypothetical protein [Mycobacteroides abscessus subsp. massiliense]WKE45635.1 hypothetical protein P3M63_07475 [Mycobacteroides abscessus subsp. massiliense]